MTMVKSDSKTIESRDKTTRTPLPRGPFAAISVMYFTNSLSQTILFPFAAVMVQSFHVTDDPAKLGYYAGYLASSAFTGSLLSSSFWGALSDRIGRKPVLLTGLAMNLVCALLFGSSQSFTMAMTVRFINGLFSTIVATGRSTVAELCDKTNQAQGFALIGTNFGAGLLIGPALGGFLCLPADKYPGLFPRGGLFDRLPFLLPCLVLAALTLLGLLSSILFLPETLGRARPIEKEEERGSSRRDSCSLDENGIYSGRWEEEEDVTSDSDSSQSGDEERSLIEQGHTPQNGESSDTKLEPKEDFIPFLKDTGQPDSSIHEPLLRVKDNEAEVRKTETRKGVYRWLGVKSGTSSENDAVGSGQVPSPEAVNMEGDRSLKGKGSPHKKSKGRGKNSSSKTFLEVLLARDTVVSALIFCVLSFVSTAFNEVFPLWCITPWDLGGLSFGTNQIAIAQVTAGVAMIPMQLYVYAPLVDKVGAINALRTAIAVGVLLLLFPLVKLFGQGTVAMQIAIGAFMAVRSFPQCVFTSVFILISNSVEDPQYLGAVNGFTQTLNMTFRAISPTAAGSLFAWSTSKRGQFINANLWVYFIGILYTVMLVLTCFLSPQAEHRKFVTGDIEREDRPSSERQLRH